MKKDVFFYPSANGEHDVRAALWLPDSRDINAVLQISHGMCEHVGRYDETAAYFVQEGYAVCANDHAGHGGSVKDTFGYFGSGDGLRTLIEDMRSLHRQVSALYPERPYFLLGHSFGSFLSRHYASLYGDELQGLLLSGTGQGDLSTRLGEILCKIPISLKGPKASGGFLNKISAGFYNRRFHPLKTKADWITSDRDKLDGFIQDPLCRFYFTCSAYATLFHVLKRVSKRDWAPSLPRRLPVYLFSGSDDPVGLYGKGVLHAYNALRQAGIQTEVKLYPGGRHEMLNEINRQEVYGDIKNWLDKLIS